MTDLNTMQYDDSKSTAERYNEAVLNASKVIRFSATEGDKYQRTLDEVERIARLFPQENGDTLFFSTLSDLLYAVHNPE